MEGNFAQIAPIFSRGAFRIFLGKGFKILSGAKSPQQVLRFEFMTDQDVVAVYFNQKLNQIFVPKD